ncbi:MAG TPA: acetyltransferase [Blastocatellia bacterium]|nr:acetyltransferase [Blastocatellia bacterium]
MKKVVIIGAGGHGREVADILRHQTQATGEIEALGFIDENRDLHGQSRDGLPVLGDWSWFEGTDRKEIAVICAVGSPRICRRLVERARSIGLSFANVVSPLALMSSFARLGEGVTIFPSVIINTGALVDSHSILNVGVVVSHDSTVGPYSNINPGARIAGNVTIGEGCYIGMGANVIQGITIGRWSIIGAGAVAINDIPPNVTAVGVPAKVIKTRGDQWHDR